MVGSLGIVQGLDGRDIDSVKRSVAKEDCRLTTDRAQRLLLLRVFDGDNSGSIGVGFGEVVGLQWSNDILRWSSEMVQAVARQCVAGHIEEYLGEERKREKNARSHLY